MSSIYMYHAVGNSDQIKDADPHYAVTEKVFTEHLASMWESQSIAHQLKNGPRITQSCITFDDGHLSNYTVAFPILKQFKYSAEFYVNTSMVGTENFMSWEQLKEMSIAGMSIQSHGHNHNYFSDMNESEIEYELKTSKELIEKHLQTEVTVFAPPGGRTDKRVAKIAKSLGYLCIANSKPGLVPLFESFEIPRFAILKNTTKEQIIEWQSRWSFSTVKEVTKYRVFKAAKILLGNERYDRVRSQLLGES